MAFNSVKNLFASVTGVEPVQFDELRKAWQVAADNGSQDSFLTFLCRERGVSEDIFLHKLAEALKWPYLELGKMTVENEARGKISTKVAFQYNVLPVAIKDGAVQVAVSNPFDATLANSKLV